MGGIFPDPLFQIKQINQVRKSTGQKPYKVKELNCLKCDAKFTSWDKTNNRICPYCKSKKDMKDHE